MEEITDILRFCSENDIDFTFQKEGNENYFHYSLLGVILNIVDEDDDGFIDSLPEKIEELKQFFK